MLEGRENREAHLSNRLYSFIIFVCSHSALLTQANQRQLPHISKVKF